jgi:hypothetical protein
MPSSLFQKYTSSNFYKVLIALDHRYSGLTVGQQVNRHGLIDELECSLEVFLVKNNTDKSTVIKLASIQAQAESYLIGVMDKSKFSYIDVMADENVWNPIQCSYEEFRMNNLNAQELTVISHSHKMNSVRDVFELLRKEGV